MLDRILAVVIGRTYFVVDNHICSATEMNWMTRMALGFSKGILELAEAHDIPVLVVIPDPIDDEGHFYIEDRLRERRADHPKLRVLRLGAERFGLDPLEEHQPALVADRARTFSRVSALGM